jgi:flagellar basal body-associated protein FliL
VPGTYRVEVGGETATYTVKEKSSLLLYALVAIILLIVGGAAYFFTKGGGDISMIQEKIRELKK